MGRGSSVVERIIGNDEVESSILSRGTSNADISNEPQESHSAHNAPDELRRVCLTDRLLRDKLLYCAWSDQSGVLKVGVSNDPLRRIREVRSQYADAFDGVRDLELKRVYACPRQFPAYTVEAAYKRSMIDYSVGTEWYHLGPNTFDFHMDVFKTACLICEGTTAEHLCDTAEAVFSIRSCSSEAEFFQGKFGRCYPNPDMFAEFDPLYAVADFPRPAPTQGRV